MTSKKLWERVLCNGIQGAETLNDRGAWPSLHSVEREMTVKMRVHRNRCVCCRIDWSSPNKIMHVCSWRIDAAIRGGPASVTDQVPSHVCLCSTCVSESRTEQSIKLTSRPGRVVPVQLWRDTLHTMNKGRYGFTASRLSLSWLILR